MTIGERRKTALNAIQPQNGRGSSSAPPTPPLAQPPLGPNLGSSEGELLMLASAPAGRGHLEQCQQETTWRAPVVSPTATQIVVVDKELSTPCTQAGRQHSTTQCPFVGRGRPRRPRPLGARCCEVRVVLRATVGSSLR